ncbi:MAG: TIGR04282 family arsenosugar biosynthesis glycosyltransferase [Thermoflavifilum sp.]|nr:TIGR04282 family arsenosugar biosynthesis glycosyltransferase [Thermoflavifilum sp.]
MGDALIIFVRALKPGQVKTRIAQQAGAQAALWIYEKLLQHTQEVSRVVKADKFVYYADEIVKDDLWPADVIKRSQSTGDLGIRMKSAFQELFSLGYQRVVIIGSDCALLNATHIHDAYRYLQAQDVVIGPALDGGYYLMGLRKPIPELFEAIPWSTPEVLKYTLAQIYFLNLSYVLLEPLPDVDFWEDVPETWKKMYSQCLLK